MYVYIYGTGHKIQQMCIMYVYKYVRGKIKHSSHTGV